MAKETFETSLKKLEDLVEQLESGDLSLEESLRCFESGVKRVNRCQTLLDTAEARVEELTCTAEGELKVTPFEREGDV